MKKTKLIVLALSVLFVSYAAAAVYYYRFPEPFPLSPDTEVEGLAYTNTLRIITKEMVDHWPVNDIFFWPSNLLDNPQNFRLGQLEAMRYATRLLRANLSRLRAEDPINPNVDAAFNNFAIDPEALLLPRAEFKYQEGFEALTRYAVDLSNNDAKFYARDDTLQQIVDEFTVLLDSTGQRLRSVSDEAFISFGDPNEQRDRSSKNRPIGDSSFLSVREADDAFYFARGVSFVLSHVLTAVRIDFGEVIATRKVGPLFEVLVSDLDDCQFEPWIVIPAAQDSMLANHTLNMQAHLINARLKLRAISSVLGRQSLGY